MGAVTMECTFQVGDRAICLCDDNALARSRGYAGPDFVKGAIYTVIDVALCPEGVGLRFAEVGDDTYWAHEDFRPVKPLSFWLGEKQEITREIERAA